MHSIATLIQLLFLLPAIIQSNRLRTKNTIDPPKYLIDPKATTSAGYTTSQGDPKGGTSKGIPIGTKHIYPFGSDCYNINNIILQGRKDAKNGPITYRQSWDESVLCKTAMENEKLMVSKNAETWDVECESYFGEICRRQCHLLSNLFDRMDYSTYPPNSNEGGADYYLNANDCTKCLISQDCDTPPRLQSSAYVDRVDYNGGDSSSISLFGNRKSRNVLLNPKKIMIAGQTTREKPLGD
jgi:hypothetical protein